MSEERDADAFYGGDTPSPAPTPAPTQAPAAKAAPKTSSTALERDADAFYDPPPPPPPEPRVVAKASASKSDGEIMFGEAPAEASAEKPEASDEPAAEEASTALIELLPDVAVKVPTGRFTEWDQAGLDAMAPIIKGHNIPAEAVQQLFDLHLNQIEQEAIHAQHELHQMMADQHAERLKGWKAAIRNDPDLRAYGLERARKDGLSTLKAYFPADFRETLQEFGLVNHPGLVKGLLRMRERLVADQMRSAGYSFKGKIR